MENQPSEKTGKWKKRLKAMGLIGFLFFLGKGLVWIVIFIFFSKSCG